jgi:Family of unknown function (DUF6150)
MRIGRTWRYSLTAFLMAITCCLSASPTNAAQSVTAIDDQGSVWIVGTDVNGYSCWNLQVPTVQIALQVQVGNAWITKSKATAKKNSALCTDPAYPYAVLYHWNVDVLGIPGDGSTKARIIMARQYIPATKKVKSYTGNAFTKQLYLSQSDLMSDYASSLNQVLGGGSGTGASGGSGFGSSKLSGCMYKGKRLYGNVFVTNNSYSADFSVFATSASYSADLNVYKTNASYAATSCGLWNFVNNAYSADFTVYFTNNSYSSDFSIYYTNAAYSAGLSH